MNNTDIYALNNFNTRNNAFLAVVGEGAKAHLEVRQICCGWFGRLLRWLGLAYQNTDVRKVIQYVSSHIGQWESKDLPAVERIVAKLQKVQQRHPGRLTVELEKITQIYEGLKNVPTVQPQTQTQPQITTPPELAPELPNSDDVNKAAAKIQKAYRQYHIRNEAKAHKLPFSLFKQAQEYLKTNLDTTSGNIIILPDIPVVVKEGQTTFRYTFSRQVRQIVSRHNYTHLVVPKARLDGQTIFEERLPHENGTLTSGMLFYHAHHKECTEAILQLTDLLCHLPLYDIVGHSQGYTNYLVKGGISPRLDNLMFFRDGERVKIGLIDLEIQTGDSFTKNPDPLRCDKAIQIAIQNFPYHYDAIISHVAKYYPISHEPTLEQLRQLQSQSLKLYDKVCVDHSNFFKRHAITLENPTKGVTITPERRKEVTENLKAWLWNMHQNGQTFDGYSTRWYKGCLKGQTQTECEANLLCYCNTVVPQALDIVQDYLHQAANPEPGEAVDAPATIADLIELRKKTEGVSYDNLVPMARERGLSDKKFFVDGFQERPNMSDIFDKILCELAEGGEVFAFTKKNSSVWFLLF